jgi:hypothetical protein
LTGASGTGKSTLVRGALEFYNSGAIALAPGKDEIDSYGKLPDNPSYVFGSFDDIMFQPSLKEKDWNIATGHVELIAWLRKVFLACKADADSGVPVRYKVLGVDTLSAVGRLAYNATLARFGLSEPPPAIGSSGAPFYSYLRGVLESSVRLMRAIRGLGVHWIVTAHPTEAEVTAIQQTEGSKISSKILPDLPGGIKNVLPSYFNVVLDVNIDSDGKHYVRWGGDPKRVTKSRFGSLDKSPKIILPNSALEAWKLLDKLIQTAYEKNLT